MNKKRGEFTIKQRVKELFDGGYRNIEQFEKRLDGVAKQTIYKYLKQLKDEEDKFNDMSNRIKMLAEQALEKGMEAYIADPSKDLQSLLGMWKQFIDSKKPTKELNNYIIIFMDLVVKYYEIKGLPDKCRGFQEDIREISEFIRVELGSF